MYLLEICCAKSPEFASVYSLIFLCFHNLFAIFIIAQSCKLCAAGVALEDDYFVERKLYPNVDFYSGIIYRALGIPTEMFTVMFALGRLPGWISQWKEMRLHGDPIGRPRQVYQGAPLS